MTDSLHYDIVKLYYQDYYWVVSYQGDHSLQYEEQEDALISVGIFSREIIKTNRRALRIILFNYKGEVEHEHFLFPSLYEENQERFVKKSLSTKSL